MWTFDRFPSAAVAKSQGVQIDQAWLDRVRQSVVRLSGCTGSFVSADGLILTNHHCVEGCLAQHSTRDKSLIESGVLAQRREDELRCATEIAEVLVATEEITALVAEAVRGLDDKAAKERRRQTLTNLEQSCEKAEALQCEAVTLYGGGQYWLYKYRRYTDVRLAFTPEDGIAAFGGDPDNFQFPRWDLDMALLRAYVSDRPAPTPNHFTIDFAGPKAGEAVFVAGHPGSTDRGLTVAQLTTLRNLELPQSLLRSSELRGRYIQFAKQSPAAERIVGDRLFGLENNIKRQRKLLDALLDDGLMSRKREDEAALRRRVESDPKLRAEIGDPWARIDSAERAQAAILLPHTYLEGAAGFNSRLFRYARSLVRAAAERPKPNPDRLREYRDSALPELERQLGAAVPIYPELEQLTLSFSLERMREWLGPDDPVVRKLLATESPDSLAAALVTGSKLADAAERMRLWKGGASAVEASHDPMIELARSVDPDARALRKRQEEDVDAVTEVAGEAIAKARFAVFGTNVYPDATFTLRLNPGTVQGWDENGTAVEPFTRLNRLFERATGRPPFAVPESWQKARSTLDPATPFNLSTNNDIVGGNSGSPLIDAQGRIVGLIFDGNIHSISGAYWFDAAQNRAVAVDTAAIREALAKVYRAAALADELGVTR
jgi:peptidase S46-like protein